MSTELASRFQLRLLTVLTLCGMGWLLYLTGLKEFWGFWQSPKVYYYLKEEYPLWIRSYVQIAYYPTLWFVLFLFSGWLTLSVHGLSSIRARADFFRRGALILLMILCLGATLGVLCANNYIGWLHQGKLHGITHLPVQP